MSDLEARNGMRCTAQVAEDIVFTKWMIETLSERERSSIEDLSLARYERDLSRLYAELELGQGQLTTAMTLADLAAVVDLLVRKLGKDVVVDQTVHVWFEDGKPRVRVA